MAFETNSASPCCTCTSTKHLCTRCTMVDDTHTFSLNECYVDHGLPGSHLGLLALRLQHLRNLLHGPTSLGLGLGHRVRPCRQGPESIKKRSQDRWHAPTSAE